MSSTTQPPSPSTFDRPQKVVVISHSPLFYWWPVWTVGFLMAMLTYLRGYQVAFVPPGTVAERGVRIEGYDAPRDVLIAPVGQPLPAVSEPDDLKQPRLRMVAGNDPGIVWATTLCIVIVLSQVPLRGLWSLVVIIVLIFTIVLLAVLGLWDPILRAVRVIDIHITGFSYVAISMFLFVVWLVMFRVRPVNRVLDVHGVMLRKGGHHHVQGPSTRWAEGTAVAAVD